MMEPQEQATKSLLLSKRKSLRQRLTTVLNEAERLLETTDVSADHAGRCELLTERIKTFATSLDEVDINLETLFTVEQADAEFDKVLEYQDRVASISCFLRRSLVPQPIAQASTTAATVQTGAAAPQGGTGHTASGSILSSTRRPNLPKLELIKFDGNMENWQEFWIRFESIVHCNSSLSNNEKMSYLSSVLKGEAAASVKGLQLTGDMYDTAVKMLQDRFGNPDSLMQFHLKRLLAIQEVRSTRNVSELRRLHDTARAHIRSLEALGTGLSSYSSLLYPVLQQALPVDLVLSFQRRLHTEAADATGTADDRHEKVLGKLLDFIKMEAECREHVAAAEGTQDPRRFTQSRDGKHTRNSQDRLPSAAALGAEASKTSKPTNTKKTAGNACFFCGKDHDVRKCRLDADLADLEERLRRSRRCFRCAKENHTARVCRSVKGLKCERCSGRHLTVLCRQGSQKTTDGTVVASGTWQHCSPYPQVVLLQTGYAILCTTDGRRKPIRILIDGGSQRTFIKKPLSRKMQLPIVGREDLAINTVGKAGKQSLHSRVSVTLRSQYTSQEVSFEALEIPEICISNLPHIDVKALDCLRNTGIQLADVAVASVPSTEISILLGADFYGAVVTGKQMRLQGNLIALETTFGWTLQGPAGDYSSPEVNTFHVDVSSFSQDDLDERLQSFWDLEHLGIADAAESPGIDPVLQRFEDSTLLENGRYSVGLPWKDNLVSRLGTNKTTAEVRLRNATRTLLKDQAVMNEYDQVIRQYLENGHAERVDVTASKVGPEYYLPHHAVIRRERETTKVRIVFDASSKSPGFLSLNDVLHAGPNLNSDILSLLLSFRMHPIALVSDIEKAFLQIGLHKQDTDALRFLWYSTTPVTGQTLPDIETWRMTRVPFGARSSPFLLSATIRHHLRQSEGDYPEAAALLQDHFYVDDLVVSVETSSDAEILYQDTLRIFEAAGMNVKKWVTNDGCLLRQMFNDGSTTVETTQDHTKKVLGLVWDVHNDKLRCPLAAILDFVANETNDKRHILQSVSRMYDPFGLLAPFTITGKILLQRIWEAELDWDDPLPEDIQSVWKEWCVGVSELEQLSLPRFLGYSCTATPRKMHVFADASPYAYGAVIYVEASSSGSSSMEFLVSKSRVAPIKRQTLPRLELMAALLAARLYRYVCTALKIVPDGVFWTDSLIALHWIRGPVTRWKTFVANRVQEIQSITSTECWRHCPGEENPADLLTRGVKGHQLQGSVLWWHGPTWLARAENWPSSLIPEPTCPDGKDEVVPQLVSSVAIAAAQTLMSPERYSRANRLCRVTAWVQRYVQNSRGRKQTGPLTTQELKNSEQYWIRMTQAKFLDKKSTHLQNFRWYKDDDGILRLYGRLQHSEQPAATKHPILLPPASEAWFTRLMVLREHERMAHAGVQETLHQIREDYWVIRGRQSVKYALHHCYFCRRLRTHSCTEQEAPLPKDRVSQQLPFDVVGVDFAGPLYYKTAHGYSKSYVTLFTCTATRAIHLELVTDQAFGTFLMAFKRFVARRGIPKKIYSDNFLTYKKASRELPPMISAQFQAVKEYATQTRSTWEFIVEQAPWWGGFWERMVRSVKESLRRSLGRCELDFQELQTVLTEVEAIVNSRPLTSLTEDPNDTEALSPSHFLIGRRLTALPSMQFLYSVDVNVSPSQIQQAKEGLLNNYWKLWSKDYLLQLRSANLSKHVTSANVRQHDLVLIPDRRQPRMFWTLGRVEQLHLGRDGLVRSCTLRTSGGAYLRRPVQLIHRLELDG
ncbi:uncharacterized protein LOC135394547 [Ornithodoros turicata]|uniref:uncharacterized protein LOC135394547 n=1 Tax=Ornithodoros turicata TaxID=34597 RepID=UPI003138E854